MGRRINSRKVKAARAYTIEELAETLGVAEVTVRGWIKDGLRALKSQRPFLIMGHDARAFLEERQSKRQRALAIDEFYCLPCRTGAKPLGGLVDYVQFKPSRGLLTGICPHCDGEIHRFSSPAQLPRFKVVFDVAFRDEEQA